MSRDCFVYWLHRPSDTDIFSQGYIGITVNPRNRYKTHLCAAKKDKNHRLYNALRKYDDFQFQIILKGSVEYCSELEAKLRNKPNIGLNHAPGGRNTLDGRLNYNFEENVKEKIKRGLKKAYEENSEYRLSVKLRNKGKVLTDSTKQKMSDAHKNKGLMWKNSTADLNVWAHADIYYLAYLKMLEECKNKKGRLSFSPRVFEQISGLAVAKSSSILKSFRAGWIPTFDSDWLNTFKKQGN